jgi:hypothetical protein
VKKLRQNASTKSTFNAYFVFGLLFFSAFYIDIWHTPNPVSRALPVLTYYETGTLEISRYQEVGLDKSKVENRYYSDKAPLPTFITIPVYELLAKMGLDEWHYEDQRYRSAPKWYTRLSMIIFLGSILCSVIPFAFMIYFSFQQGGQFKWKPMLVVLSFFGSYLFIFSGTFFNHILSGMCLALAVFLIQKPNKAWLSGLFCAFAFLSEYTLGLFAALLPLFLIGYKGFWRSFLYFCIGFSPALLIYAWYNYSLSGNPLTFIFYYTDYETFSQGIKQNYGFGFPSWESIYGLLISPYMGLLWFFPLLFFYLLRWQKVKYTYLLKDPVFVICVVKNKC